MDLASALAERVKHGALRVSAAPVVALGVLQSTSDERAAHAALRLLLERRPAMAELVVRLANSPRFRWGPDVKAAQQAVVVVGRRALRELCVAAELHQWVFSGAHRSGLPLRRRAWREALCSASIASWLAPRFEQSAEEAFQTALFHDLGRVAVIGALERLLDAHGHPVPLDEQWALVEAHQVELGLRLAKLWSLPSSLTAAITRSGSELLSLADSLVTQLETSPLVTGTRVLSSQVVPQVAQLAATLSAFREPVFDETDDDDVLVVNEPIPGRGVVLSIDDVVTEAVVQSANPHGLVVDAVLELERLVLVCAGEARFHAVVRGHEGGGSRLVPWALSELQAEQWRLFVESGFEDLYAMALGA